MKNVSIILPTYNEANNIVELIKEIEKSMSFWPNYEIIVIDDNSPDNTLQLVKDSFRDDNKIVTILRTSDRGLAKSIREGIERSTGDQIVIMDTDFTHDPEEIPKLIHVGQIYDIVSASRFSPGGHMQDTGHYIGSLLYNWLMRIVLRTQIQDNLGGYFTIKTEKLRLLPFDLIFFGYGDYFFRLLHYAQYNKFSIVEIPAIYCSRTKGTSKSSYYKMLLNYTKSMILLKISSKNKKIE